MTNSHNNNEWWLGFAWGVIVCSGFAITCYLAHLISNGIR